MAMSNVCPGNTCSFLPLKVKHKSHKTQNKQKKKQTQNSKLVFKTLMMLGIICRRC